METRDRAGATWRGGRSCGHHMVVLGGCGWPWGKKVMLAQAHRRHGQGRTWLGNHPLAAGMRAGALYSRKPWGVGVLEAAAMPENTGASPQPCWCVPTSTGWWGLLGALCVPGLCHAGAERGLPRCMWLMWTLGSRARGFSCRPGHSVGACPLPLSLQSCSRDSILPWLKQHPEQKARGVGQHASPRRLAGPVSRVCGLRAQGLSV